MMPQTVIIREGSGSAGIASFIFGLISIFLLAPIFVPLAIVFGIIAVIKGQYGWGVTGFLCAFIGFITSPILMGMFAVTTVLSQNPKDIKPVELPPQVQSQSTVSDPVKTRP